MKHTFITIAFLLWSATVYAQAAPDTLRITATDKFAWTASDDEGKTFGDPPVQLVTGYHLEFFLKSNVTITGTTAAPIFVPKAGATASLLFNNIAHTAPDVTREEISTQTLSTFIGVNVNVEYVAFMRAAGSGGISILSNGVGPFGLLAAPKAPAFRIRRIP